MRGYHEWARTQAQIARERQHLTAARAMLGKKASPKALNALIAEKDAALDARAHKLLDIWPQVQADYSGDEYKVKIRGRELTYSLKTKSLSGTPVPRVALPKWQDEGEILQWLLRENVPGSYPYTAGVFAFKREGEDPTRMFAGEGDAARTNRRFHYLSANSDAKRLSTAFDSVTLYGQNPALQPDIYGKVGTSGVSISTLEDMKILYSGFDLCAPATSVSMTINGPAPTILAMFLNTAIDQQIDKFREDNGRAPTDEEIAKIRDWTLSTVRGTVQADILKEDQGQNTCLFSTEFSLKVMGDIAQYFVQHDVRNFYSVSISGYHIAEAGANPITQLALTLSNGFTYVESYLSRGMNIDDFAPNLSFFFSYGMDPEYSVIGRVARRIWATVMREKYGASERSQKLKFHSQTSGRSLHAQEYSFNDIRTTLQALISTYDNTNSLHTNAYDEAITTPTEESVRRAMAIQLIINKEWGLAKNENPNQGSFIVDELTDLVEEAVLAEFDRIGERGGVLGAMELGYQRGLIQEESLYYETLKHDGDLPIVGVNTFRNPNAEEWEETTLELDARHGRREAGRARGAGALPRHARGRDAGNARTPARGGAPGRQRVRRADGRRARLLPRPDHPDPVRGRREIPAEYVIHVSFDQMIIYIDTSIIIRENFFRSAVAIACLHAAKLLNISVYIPQVVVDEAKYNIKKQLTSAEKKLDECNKLIGENSLTVDWDVKSENLLKEFDKILSENDVILLPYPNTEHEVIVDRIYSNKRPFQGKETGYKDYLIWLSILKHLQQDSKPKKPIFLVNNPRDFLNDEKSGLHEDLENDILVPGKEIEILSNMKDLFETKIQEMLPELPIETYNQIDVASINDNLVLEIEQQLPGRVFFGIKGLAFSNEVTVDSVQKVELSTERVSSPDREELFFLKLGNIELELVGCIEKSTYWTQMEVYENLLNVVDYDWNDQMMLVSQVIVTPVSVAFFYKISENKIIYLDITLVDEVDTDNFK